MRLLIALAAAAGLAGCQVELEGAACAEPGGGEQCPSGQRCGNDLRCSERAAACADRCAAGERRCVDGDVRTCLDDDPVCGTWRLDLDCAAGLQCRLTGADAACFCPPSDGAEIVVDAEAGAPAGWPAPTGARTPAACRFATLEAGLEAARAGVAPVVVAAGAAATYPVTATLAVPAGVTLRGDDAPPAPERRVLSLEGELAEGVTLAEGAALSGFTVRSGTAPAATGVRIACAASTAAARVEDVVIGEPSASGGTPLAQGLRVEGACPVELARVTVTGASGPGLLVARDAADQTVAVADSTFDGNHEGVQLTRGDLTLQRGVVAANAGSGVLVKSGQDGRITLDACTIRDNVDTGVVLEANTARVWITGTRLCRNGAVTGRGAFTTKRKVGGLYIAGNPPSDAKSLAFTGNALHGNAGDQLLVSGGAFTWNLDGGSSCGPGRNVFGAYAASPAAGLVADSAVVSALWNGWAGGIPSPGFDYQAISGGITAAVNVSQYCDPPTAAELLCDD